MQKEGRFEEALPLMLSSVAMRERSHTLCLSLSELAELYLDMLALADADIIATRMIEEAHRYDTAQQLRIATEILEDIDAAKRNGVEFGAEVVLGGLVRRSDLNGKLGVVRGRLRSNGRYCVDVGHVRLLVRRCNFRTITAMKEPVVEAPA